MACLIVIKIIEYYNVKAEKRDLLDSIDYLVHNLIMFEKKVNFFIPKKTLISFTSMKVFFFS